MGTASEPQASIPRRGLWALLALLVVAVAFASRLLPVLRGGGLYGLIGYDGAVYYTAGAGLARGLRPYTDFLLLHPPGIVLALLPFGLLGRVLGDPGAMALARLAWMGLGSLSALLVAATLRRYGLVAALVGGLLYAVWVPAIYVERTTALEAVTNLLTLAAVWLLARPAPDRLHGRPAFVAGLFLGVSCATKIWGVAALVAVAVWCAVEHGARRAVVLLAGAAVSVVAICLPFFVLAPGRMWDMVVGAQLGRARVRVGWYTKAVDTAGLSDVRTAVGTLLVVVLVLLVVAVGLTLRLRVGRLGLVLLLVGLGLLAASPSWTTDYASLVAAPVALLGGAATGVVSAALARAGALRVVAVLLVVVAVAGYVRLSAPNTRFGSGFAGRAMASLVADVPGCVTTDDPTALVEADVLGRNLARGCPLVADLGGYSYYLRPGAELRTARSKNAQFQAYLLDYLGSGGATIVVRFAEAPGLSAQTRSVVEDWPVLGQAGRYAVRRPVR